MKGASDVGQGQLETLVNSLTERGLSIRRYENGVVDVSVENPKFKVVICGGGGKGAALSGFPGAAKAHQAHIESYSGSSAGAIAAAFLASGMDDASFDKMSDETNLLKLLDSPNKILGTIQDVSTAVGKGLAKIPGKAGSIAQLLFDLIPRLNSEAVPLEILIREKTVESINTLYNDALNDPRRQLSDATKARVKELTTRGHVTFADLAALSRDMPEIKPLHITGTAMFDGRTQLVVFNADLTPDMDVARAAHISGSLPIVFHSPSQDELPFQANGEHTRFKDGGIMLNTPVPEIYEPQFPMSAIPESELLILKFQTENGGEKKDRGTPFSVLVDKFLGAPYKARDAQEADRLKSLEKYTVTVPLKTEKGDFTGMLNGTVNFNMPPDIKNHLQQELNIEVDMHLASRRRNHEIYSFNSIGGALLALDDQLFDAGILELKNDPASEVVITFRQQAQLALAELRQALIAAKVMEPDRLELTADMLKAINCLDELGNTPVKSEWLAKKLNHGNTPDYMELLQAVKRMDVGTTGPKSVVLTQAIVEMGTRDIITKSENFIREVIYPSLYRLDQPDSNVKLLNRAIADLRETTSATGYNNVLNRIADQYVSRNFPSSSRPFNSTTVDQARAWLIPG